MEGSESPLGNLTTDDPEYLQEYIARLYSLLQYYEKRYGAIEEDEVDSPVCFIGLFSFLCFCV